MKDDTNAATPTTDDTVAATPTTDDTVAAENETAANSTITDPLPVAPSAEGLTVDGENPTTTTPVDASGVATTPSDADTIESPSPVDAAPTPEVVATPEVTGNGDVSVEPSTAPELSSGDTTADSLSPAPTSPESPSSDEAPAVEPATPAPEVVAAGNGDVSAEPSIAPELEPAPAPEVTGNAEALSDVPVTDTIANAAPTDDGVTEVSATSKRKGKKPKPDFDGFYERLKVWALRLEIEILEDIEALAEAMSKAGPDMPQAIDDLKREYNIK